MAGLETPGRNAPGGELPIGAQEAGGSGQNRLAASAGGDRPWSRRNAAAGHASSHQRLVGGVGSLAGRARQPAAAGAPRAVEGLDAASSAWGWAVGRSAGALSDWHRGGLAGGPGIFGQRLATGGARSVDRVGDRSPVQQPALRRVQLAVADCAVGHGGQSGIEGVGGVRGAVGPGLGGALRLPAAAAGDLRRSAAPLRRVLPGSELGVRGAE